jgi:hypothetical protein
MALTKNQLSDGTIEVIARIDDAIVRNDEKYAEYLNNLNEDVLEFVPGKYPTKFVMRKILPWKEAIKVQNKQVRFEKGEAQFQMAFMSEEVRCSLIDIKNPANIADDDKINFEKHKDDLGASEDLMAKLMSAGIVQDLYVARKNFLEGSKGSADLKKS